MSDSDLRRFSPSPLLRSPLPLPLAGKALRLLAECRFRIAGGASPGSGPALTLGSDF
jgi:hypothetical protein